jgi:hypothetical protein
MEEKELQVDKRYVCKHNDWFVYEVKFVGVKNVIAIDVSDNTEHRFLKEVFLEKYEPYTEEKYQIEYWVEGSSEPYYSLDRYKDLGEFLRTGNQSINNRIISVELLGAKKPTEQENMQSYIEGLVKVLGYSLKDYKVVVFPDNGFNIIDVNDKSNRCYLGGSNGGADLKFIERLIEDL